MKTKYLRACPLIAMSLLFSAPLLHAQGGATGTILGTVTDSSGAVVPKATVTVTNVGTSVSSHTETSGTGNYTVPYLNPGVYRVTVEAQGFQEAVIDKISLAVDHKSGSTPPLSRGLSRRSSRSRLTRSRSTPTQPPFPNSSATSRWRIFRTTAGTGPRCFSSPPAR